MKWGILSKNKSTQLVVDFTCLTFNYFSHRYCQWIWIWYGISAIQFQKVKDWALMNYVDFSYNNQWGFGCNYYVTNEMRYIEQK